MKLTKKQLLTLVLIVNQVNIQEKNKAKEDIKVNLIVILGNRSKSSSRNRLDSRKSKKRDSVDSKYFDFNKLIRSSETYHRHKKSYREEKYDKFIDKNKKDYKYEDNRRFEKSRDRINDRSRDHYREKDKREKNKDKYRERSRDRKKNSRRSSSSKKRSHRKSERSRSRSYKYSSKIKDQINVKNSYEKSFSKENTPSIEIKKKIEEIVKLNNFNTPISTSEPSKRNREIFINNLPEGLTPKEVMELMNTAMIAMDANLKSGNPIIGAWMSTDQNCSFLEFRTPEEANNSLKLDGISLLGNVNNIKKSKLESRDIKTKALLKIPVINIFNHLEDMFPTLSSFERDLNNPYLNRTMTQAATIVKTSTAVVPTNTAATSKLLISNLPLSFDQNAVLQVLRTFGKIKNIELINDPITGKSSGNCHVEYETETATANALHCNFLINFLDIMGMNLMGNTLYIRRSAGIMPVYSISSSSTSNTNLNGNINLNINEISSNINTMGTTTGLFNAHDELIKQMENLPSKIICFKNMISLKEIEDEDEYDDLYDDVMEECKNYGKVIQVKIPRPDSNESVQGLGKVFVEYATRDGASFAKEHLQGKNFRGRKVEVINFPEDLFRRNQLN